MKAIILSAGRGARLGSFTYTTPKCLLRFNDSSILKWQLRTLQYCGIEKIHVVVGFAAQKVENEIYANFSSSFVDTIYNPFYATSENMISCWLATPYMNSDFLLLNGDTLFEPSLLQKLTDSAVDPITVGIDQKDFYDPDDMKVIAHDHKLSQIGKHIPQEEANGEAIGLHLFQGQGPALFKNTLDKIICSPKAHQLWYLSAINALSNHISIGTCRINGFKWTEIDYPEDLERTKNFFFSD